MTRALRLVGLGGAVAIALTLVGVALGTGSARAIVDPCASAIPGSPTALACPDTDGDGFPDAEELNGYIDLNADGTLDKGDFAFPLERSPVFSDVTHTGTGTGMVFPTVTDPGRQVPRADVVVTIAASGRVGNATFTYTVNGHGAKGPQTIHPVVDLASHSASDVTSNLRLEFYFQSSAFVAGDTYAFSVSMGGVRKIADANVPNVYVQWDYMGWAEPGAACTTDDDVPPEQPNLVCHDGHLNHTDYPGDPLFREVVDQFAAHGITLYVFPQHAMVPHAVVVTFAKAGDGTTGPLASCAGWDVVPGDISNGHAVSFFDIKNRPGSDFLAQPVRRSVYHYAVFGEYSTCLTDGAGVGSCPTCPLDRATPSGLPRAGMLGLAELPGNDFMITMASRFFDPTASTARNPFSDGGPFMHELGHNLGLHHDGDVGTPDLAANYLSVMNNKYVRTGIEHAATPGSAVPVESLRTLDYSEHTLNSLDESNLDENAGLSPLSAGYTGIVRFKNGHGGSGVGPESGPVDWSGNGAIDASPVAVDLNQENGATETMRGYGDWRHGPCTSAADTPVNAVRKYIHDNSDPSVDPHEPCVRGYAQSLWYGFQTAPWGRAD